MQINDHIALTSDLVSCATCRREFPGASVRAGTVRLCSHASPDEVRRILALLAEDHRRRSAPRGQVLETAQSQHHNGTYEISALPDGSYACTCLGFLGSRDLAAVQVDGAPRYAACRHIQDRLPTLDPARARLGRAEVPANPPSDWQKLVLKAFVVATGVSMSEPTADWMCAFVSMAIKTSGSTPVHLISDRGSQFTAGRFRAMLRRRGIRQRFGAVGCHGSISLVERFWRTLKSECLDATCVWLSSRALAKIARRAKSHRRRSGQSRYR